MSHRRAAADERAADHDGHRRLLDRVSHVVHLLPCHLRPVNRGPLRARGGGAESGLGVSGRRTKVPGSSSSRSQRALSRNDDAVRTEREERDDAAITERAGAPGVTRRRMLTWIGAAGAAIVAAACGRGHVGRVSYRRRVGGRDSDRSRGDAVACVLSPEMTEGPYYIDGEAVRRDVTEGKPGVPLTLDLNVADATTCSPLPDAAVEIWHADAGGNYSGFNATADNTTFLRGVQIADAPATYVRYRLSGLVRGPRDAHPPDGARGRRRRAHGPALLRRADQRCRLRGLTVRRSLGHADDERPGRHLRERRRAVHVALTQDGDGYGAITLGVQTS